MPKVNLMETSQWVAFFKKAGLPPNVASNYALIFYENRIQVDMLLDLSKEYLYDMGIKVMGDVIAILKFAKEFHTQLAKERIIGSSPPVISRTPVERMVGHYTRPSPVRGPSSFEDKDLSKRSTIISLKRKTAVQAPATKIIRRVPPEEEGAYRIKMPLGTTPKTQKILQQQSAQSLKRSVFSRLGDSAVVSSSTDSKVSSSVFERLGSANKSVDELPSSTVQSDFERPKIIGSPLPYKGVLKMTINKNSGLVSPPRKVNLATRTVLNPRRVPLGRNIVKTVRLNQINDILQGNESQRIAITRSVKNPIGSQGIFGQKAVAQRLHVKSRLGNQMDARNLRSNFSLAKGPVKSSSNVFTRLGR